MTTTSGHFLRHHRLQYVYVGMYEFVFGRFVVTERKKAVNV